MSVFKFIKILVGVLLLVGLVTTRLIIAQEPLGLSQGRQPFPGREEPPFVPGEVLVKFRPHVSRDGAQRSLEAEGLRAIEVSPHSGLIRVEVPPGLEEATRARLMARGDVEMAALNHIFSTAFVPDDPFFASQWGLAKIEAPAAWDITTGSGNVIVAVVDSGVDMGHIEFNGRIVDAYDTIDDDAMAEDTCGHGTHVTGIIAAEGDNGQGVAGVAWGVKILPVRALTIGQGGCTGTEFDIHEGIDWAAGHGAKVINLSLGAPPSGLSCEQQFPVMSQAVKDAFEAGILVVAAAGNNSAGLLGCPALQAEAMAVGATTAGDERASYSNYGTGLSVVGPGSGIYSTYWGGGYTSLSGTSMAAPHVAGVAGLVWSAIPWLTLDEVWHIIEESADDLGPAGYDLEYGHGRVNARQALELPLAAVELQEVTGEPLPAPIWFMVDDGTGPFPAAKVVQISTANPEVLTWSVTISPGVSWLEVRPPQWGLVSSAGPGQFTLAAGRPVTYGIYTTSMVVTGTGPGIGVAPVWGEVRINFVPRLSVYYFPILLKN